MNKTFGKNALSLYGLQFSNYLLPLITVPYVVRVLGVDLYGTVAFAQSLVLLLSSVVDYGFDLSATRKVSVIRADRKAVGVFANSVWGAKVLLAVASLGFLFFLTLVVTQLYEIRTLLFILYGLVVGNLLFPTWLYQGMERMSPAAIIRIVSQSLGVVCIFLLVRNQEDYVVYAGIMSATTLASGIIAASLGIRLFGTSIAVPHPQQILEVLKNGWVIFVSKVFVNFYTIGNPFLLGMLTNTVAVGYFSAAEKIVRACMGLLGPISEAAYPVFSRMAAETRSLAMFWSRRMLAMTTSVGALLSLVLILGASPIALLLLGQDYINSISVLRILAPVVTLVAASNVLGIQVMLPFGKERAFTVILIFAGLINVLLALVLAPAWRETGMAVAVVTTEFMVTFTMFMYLRRIGISPLMRTEKVSG